MMIMLFRGKTKEEGAASMIVVIFMSIILTIVTIGFIRIAINEQRDSTDDDLTARAYYAAESGLEDAKRAIQEDLAGTLNGALNENTCDPPGVVAEYDPVLSTGAFDIEYTCMLLDYTPDTIRSELSSANQTKQYDVNPVNQSTPANTDIGSITMDWHFDALPENDGDGLVGGGGSVNIRPQGALSIPQFGTWSFPAMMEVTFLSYPSGNFTRGDIEVAKILVSPTAPGGSNGSTPTSVFIGGTASAAVDGRVLGADCVDNDNGMVCSMEFDFSGMDQSRQLVMRLTNLYRSTSFELSMQGTAAQGSPTLLFDDAQVVVDVTGRAGGVYRRVEAALELSSPEFVPNHAIQSATDICKDFSFTNVASEFGGIAGTSCTAP